MQIRRVAFTHADAQLLVAEVQAEYVARYGGPDNTPMDSSVLDVIVLETGIAQPEAIALYESSGYEPVEKFGHYAWSPKSRCYGKRL